MLRNMDHMERHKLGMQTKVIINRLLNRDRTERHKLGMGIKVIVNRLRNRDRMEQLNLGTRMKVIANRLRNRDLQTLTNRMFMLPVLYQDNLLMVKELPYLKHTKIILIRKQFQSVDNNQ